MPSSIAKRRSEFIDRSAAVLADRLDIHGLVARGWLTAEQSPAHRLANRVAGLLGNECPREVLKRTSRRTLLPVTVERRAQALIELEQLWERPLAPDATEVDVIEAALYRRKLAIDAGLITRRRNSAMWLKMERRLAKLRREVAALQRSGEK